MTSDDFLSSVTFTKTKELATCEGGALSAATQPMEMRKV
jgi:hypothetical protein